MDIININSYFSIIISKIIIKVSKKVFKGGTNFPGKVALKIDKNILKHVTYGYKVILIDWIPMVKLLLLVCFTI